MLTIAQQSHQSRDLAFTVVGFFPNGEGYSDTVLARDPEEAKIRVISDLCYAEEGGDLEVSCVVDAAGKVVADSAGGAFDMLVESEALELLISHLRETIPGPAISARSASEACEVDTLNTYLELFELVLSDAPHVLDGLAVGAQGYADEDLMLHFIDSMGVSHEIIPAEALVHLARKSRQLGLGPAAVQLEALATRARFAVSLAVLESICES